MSSHKTSSTSISLTNDLGTTASNLPPLEPASITHLRKLVGMTQIPTNVIVAAARDVIRDYDLERERMTAMRRP